MASNMYEDPDQPSIEGGDQRRRTVGGLQPLNSNGQQWLCRASSCLDTHDRGDVVQHLRESTSFRNVGKCVGYPYES